MASHGICDLKNSLKNQTRYLSTTTNCWSVTCRISRRSDLAFTTFIVVNLSCRLRCVILFRGLTLPTWKDVHYCFPLITLTRVRLVIRGQWGQLFAKLSENFTSFEFSKWGILSCRGRLLVIWSCARKFSKSYNCVRKYKFLRIVQVG